MAFDQDGNYIDDNFSPAQRALSTSYPEPSAEDAAMKPINISGVGNRMMIERPGEKPIDEFGASVSQDTAKRIKANLGDAPISPSDMAFFGMKPPSEDELNAFDKWQQFQKHIEPVVAAKSEKAREEALSRFDSSFTSVDMNLMSPAQKAAHSQQRNTIGESAYKSVQQNELSAAKNVFDMEYGRQLEEKKYQRNIGDKKTEENELVKSLAKGVGDGLDAPIAIKNTRGVNIHARVKKEVRDAYPKFDFTMADANYKWKHSSTNQRTINFVGGALPRLGALDAQLKELPNVDLNVINRIMKTVLTETGKPAYTNYESNRNAIVQEINTALSGSSQSSDMRLQIELENLKSARSPDQIKGAIENLRAALEARLDVDLSPLYPIEVVRGEKSMSQYKKELYSKYRNDYRNHFGGEQKAQEVGVGTAPPASALKEGVQRTFKNGQVWALINGKPVQVK